VFPRHCHRHSNSSSRDVCALKMPALLNSTSICIYDSTSSTPFVSECTCRRLCLHSRHGRPVGNSSSQKTQNRVNVVQCLSCPTSSFVYDVYLYEYYILRTIPSKLRGKAKGSGHCHRCGLTSLISSDIVLETTSHVWRLDSIPSVTCTTCFT
jgi:hypothetical protein